MKPVIETHALCKSYHGRLVVDHLDLCVPEGCVYGFLGPNGAGKSTTMKMLLGLVHPTGGSVALLGQPMNEKNRIPLLRQTGSLIESPSGYLHLTARENLAIVADLKGVDRRDTRRVLDIVHLTKDADRKVGQYSLGMKQRLGIAMALLGSPRLLILDEPTNGLDPAGIQEMRSLIASMPQTTGATVLISSHLLGEIEQMVDQVGILSHGKLLFEGSLQQLQKHSRGGTLLRVLTVPKALAVLQQQGHVLPGHAERKFEPFETGQPLKIVLVIGGIVGVNGRLDTLKHLVRVLLGHLVTGLRRDFSRRVHVEDIVAAGYRNCRAH